MALTPLFMAFLRVGTFTFGGGQSIIPLMKEECVGAGWVTEEQFLEGLAVGNALPGPIATKMALWVGWQEAGLTGAAVALIGLLLPSTTLMAIFGGVLLRYRGHPVIAAALEGLKPAIVGMLFFVAWDLAPSGIRDNAGFVLAVASFLALWWKVPPALVVLAAMVVGVAISRG